MSEKRIKNQFQKALESYASAVDEDQLWSEIEDRVPKKEKKRRGLFWLVFGLPVLAVVLIGFWFLAKTGTESSTLNIQTNSYGIENKGVRDEKEVIISNGTDNLNLKDNLELENEVLQENKNVPQYDRYKKQIVDFKKSNRENKKILENKNSFVAVRTTEEEIHTSTISRNRSELDRGIEHVLAIPMLEFRPQTEDEIDVKLPGKKSKRTKKIKPLKTPRSFVGINYYVGKYFAKEKLSAHDEKYIDYGEAYFSQGLSLSYNRFFSSRLYGRVIVAMDKSYKKFSAKIEKDTIVPSSQGAQTISYNQYQNGVIDTESGIPNVNGVYNRDVINNNGISSLSMGLGLGYLQPVGKLNVNLEVDVQRTMYYDVNGLGRENSNQKIEELEAFEDYFSKDPKYLLNTQLSIDFEWSKSIRITTGVQYQFGMNSILNAQTGHVEKMNLLRGNLGLKKILE